MKRLEHEPIAVSTAPAVGDDSRPTIRFPVCDGPGVAMAPPPAPSDLAHSSAGKLFVMGQACDEYLQRREAGEELSVETFCRQYPDVASSLQKVIGAHNYLAANADEFGDATAVTWPMPGESFLGFRIQRELGRGWFARFYRATETALGGRPVTLKISPRGEAEAEAEKLGLLRHPNVVPVYSVVQEPRSGLTVICMPYLGSATLGRVLDLAFAHNGRPPASARIILEAARDRHGPEIDCSPPASVLRHGPYVNGVLHLAVQIAEALALIHARGVCHRDLKPSNVLLRPDGTPLLLDFNLAQDVIRDQGFRGGTLQYMAPEELQAARDDDRHAAPDLRSDLFAFGVLFFELLSGQHPFGPLPDSSVPRELCTYLLRRQTAAPRRLDLLNPDVDAGLAALIPRCLSYRPEERPKSAGEVATALRAAMSPLRRTRRRMRRHSVVLSAVLIAALALSAVACWRSAAQPPYSERQLQLGGAAYAAQDFKQAITYYSRAADAEPTRADAFFRRARAYQALGELDRNAFWLALEDYQQAEQRGGAGRAKAGMGYCLSRLGLTREAIEKYNLAIATGFATAEVYNNLGHSYRLMRNTAQAKKCLDRAIELNPELTAARHNRALLRYQTVFELSALLFPKHGVCRLAPAVKATRLRELQECDRGAKEDIEAALQLRPACAGPYLTAARFYAIAAARGESSADAALGYVSQALDRGQDPRELRTDTAFDSLRHLPAFQARAARVTASATPAPPSVLVVDPVAASAD